MKDIDKGWRLYLEKRFTLEDLERKIRHWLMIHDQAGFEDMAKETEKAIVDLCEKVLEIKKAEGERLLKRV